MITYSTTYISIYNTSLSRFFPRQGLGLDDILKSFIKLILVRKQLQLYRSNWAKSAHDLICHHILVYYNLKPKKHRTLALLRNGQTSISMYYLKHITGTIHDKKGDIMNLTMIKCLSTFPTHVQRSK